MNAASDHQTLPADPVISERGRTMQTKVLGEHLAHWAQTTPDAPAITYLDYLRDPDGAPETVTYAELDARVDAMARHLLTEAEPGDRVAILAPQSMAYIVAFVACVRAGLVAVPLFSPDLPGHGDRLASTFADCDPMVALATRGNVELVEEFLRSQPGGASAIVLVIDGELEAADDVEVRPRRTPDDLAYIQYTSGSTRLPAGVMITQGNIVANASQAIVALHTQDEEATVVSWLPLFHDMGLVFVVGGSIVGGLHTVVLDPISFLIDPARWMRALADHPNTISLAPNFAYAYAAAKVGDDVKAELDLSGVRSLGNGAEPVRPETLDAFQEAFGPCGLRPHTVRPVYGLAEATVYVSGATIVDDDGSNAPVPDVELDVVALSEGRATTEIADDSGAQRMVSVGLPNDQYVAIVDPATERRCTDGTVGEIWVLGPNVSPGYWDKDELSAEVFGRRLDAPGDLPAEPWMRTGDLGTMLDGTLYITGRMKDLIIIGGRNHYPQDLEATVEGADPVIGRHRTAAFAIDLGDEEVVVVVAEVSRHAEAGTWDALAVGRRVAEAVSRRHSVAVHDVMLVDRGRVPRTSSGKIARSATRELYLSGALEPVGVFA